MNEHGTSTDDCRNGDADAEVQGYATGLLPYATMIDAQRFPWATQLVARPLSQGPLTQPSPSGSSFSNEPGESPRHIPT